MEKEIIERIKDRLVLNAGYWELPVKSGIFAVDRYMEGYAKAKSDLAEELLGLIDAMQKVEKEING